jgi:DNA primase
VAKFPRSFVDDLRLQADIVLVVQDYVSLKKAGGSFKGLCPFHGEKTPSFHVNRERGFFHCFGCGVGGDVFKFVEMQEKVDFHEAVLLLARRFGVPVPVVASEPEGESAAEREALLKMHEVAAAYFREQLLAPAGNRARQQLRGRGVSAATIELLQLGYATQSRDGLVSRLTAAGFAAGAVVRGGLAAERDGRIGDRFRGRLIIPIARDTGSIVAFAGRAMEPDQQPKYLNSPETAIYSKGRLLYGLHLAKAALRRSGYAVLVEGYFDVAQAIQAGLTSTVATCGTALTAAQVRLLRRFTSKVVLSYDPDSAGQGAAARSCDLLVAEGFQVNVAALPAGEDPDSFIRKSGGKEYAERLQASRPYLDFLLERAASGRDFRQDEDRRQFLVEMLALAARIPDPASRDHFADRVAHRAGVTEDVVRAQIRRLAVDRRTTLTERELPGLGELKQAEKGLVWCLVHEAAAGQEAVGWLEEADFEHLLTANVLRVARSLHGCSALEFPSVFLQRLSTMDAQLVAGIAAAPAPPAPPVECAAALRRLRFERERAAVQLEINRLQETGSADNHRQIDQLWERKKSLLQQIETLTA